MTDPVGEDGWLALVDEASRTAGDLEQRIGVVELYKRAIAAEPWSNKLWLAYCEWVWSLYTDCQNGDAGWPEEEQLLGQELFSLDTALDVWQQGAQATQYRLNDSHELWNRWMSIELEQLAASPDEQKIERVQQLFRDRLQVPHAAWDETSQTFSTFISKYKEAVWETTMVETTKLAKAAKDLCSHREAHELRLQRATESGDKEAVNSEMRGYLNWEMTQAGKRNKKGGPTSPLILCVALFERALSSTTLGLDPAVWEDYIVFLSTSIKELQDSQLPAVLPVIQRATNHCPWSGTLWARYILCAESEDLPFATMEQIKHAATNTRDLDRDGMASVVEFYIAWSGYLKRLTMAEGATDEDVDVAEMGLPTALEDVQQWGKRRHGKEWKGDPLFRIERIFIQHLTQKRSFEEARTLWRKLVKTHADSYEFWQQYYLWEMTVRISTAPPANATAVLVQAIHRKTLDWPEKMMEIYVRHCHNYEDVDKLLGALTSVHQLSKQVAKRREYEAAQYIEQQPEVPVQDVIESEPPPGESKRKRDSEDVGGAASKKVKSEDQAALREQHLKRDRENTTVLVTNLPAEVTQTKARQYFKEYGHINSLTLKTEADKLSTTALIEFRTPEEAQSALLRDGKYFVDKQIHVTPGTGLTLYVTNFPPTADDAYLRKLFKDCGEIFSIRWPSLKHNTHRRFCYISFRTAEGAVAATQLDGHPLGGVYKLVSKYSDPTNKKDREGAMAEGREIHVTSLDPSLTEDDLKEVFSKYGKVERVRILKTMGGESKGAGFIAFEKKEEATGALELDKTKLKSKVLNVEMAVGKNFKATATSLGKASSASPAPDADGDSAMSPSPAPDGHLNTHAQHAPSRTEITNRTVTLMNIPDTVNDARIRVLAEPYGEIVKLVLKPDHQGAIIEYADAASAGKAALALENQEIAPGRKLRTGGMKDLFAEKPEIKSDRIQTGQGKKAAFMQPSAPVRRPGPGGRGGLGIKRGLGYSAKPVSTGSNSSAAGEAINGNGAENKRPKSNADFKAMFVSGGTE
jgi:RNA recognition motif-containing protein